MQDLKVQEDNKPNHISFRGIALAGQYADNAYWEIAGMISNVQKSLYGVQACRVMHKAQVQQSLNKIFPDSYPFIVVLQAEAEFVRKINDDIHPAKKVFEHLR